MTLQPHSWTYIWRKMIQKNNAPLCSLQHCLQQPRYGSIEEFVVPAAVTTIPSQAFWCCESLATITIHANVTKIKSAAFVYCYGLQTVVFENTTGWTVDAFDSVTGEPFSQTIKSSDLANVQTAAQLLKEDHVLCDWIRA